MPDLKCLALLSAFVFLDIVAAQETGLGTCTDVHIFLSRGNNEPYPGRQGKLVQAICSGLESCDYEDVAFDNALAVEYCSAVEAGRKAGIAQITDYNKRCPDTKLVVSGYSQGAHVLGDILGGGGGVFFQDCTTPTVPGLDPNSAPGNSISVALLFGDTRHTANQPYNTLEGATINGLFPRSGQQLEGINNFAGVLRDWCQGDDPICAAGDGKGTYNVQHHLNYFDVYSDAAAEWVKSMLGEATTPTPTSGSTSGSTTVSSSTATSTASSTSTAVEETSSGVTASETTASETQSVSITSASMSLSSPSSTSTSTPLPEGTDSGTAATPTASSTAQGGSVQGVWCYKGYIGLSILYSFLFAIA
ncbi:carbohydrate esterase family 5 protein [Daldinia decipiens]|uniref:carbohydrate esterase family 5 protein n=1 Tax=Daldinia decipiens TaxID=326647 RepID=UPI0020C43D4B|nr:carbohydrate esterase family 5 protein [Daldinia decipiens]KAI1652540.1 carbohydrate esterase family 5 protein [Daldinia decipiens]